MSSHGDHRPPPSSDPSGPVRRRRLSSRALTGIVAAAAVLVLGLGGFLIGSRIYADQRNAAAPEAFTATAEASAASDGGGGGSTGAPAAGEVGGTWTVAEGSQAGYRVAEVLNGQDVTVVGRTSSVTGSAEITGTSLSETRIVVDLASVETDAAQRDEYFRTRAIDTAAHPEAVFTLTAPVDVAALAETGTATVTVPGTLEINGQTQDVRIALTLARSQDGTLTVVGAADATWSDYGVEAPDLGFVSVEDAGQIEFSLVLAAA
ncbi:YceI family protein [Brachybacterium phenoliresistens]|uniref:YceI family protein n=1 Tax=Brachybacterium phenoliresistens TaxID=396014 RepID=UPI0031E17154